MTVSWFGKEMTQYHKVNNNELLFALFFFILSGLQSAHLLIRAKGDR
jgi:hypothetical protein